MADTVFDKIFKGNVAKESTHEKMIKRPFYFSLYNTNLAVFLLTKLMFVQFAKNPRHVQTMRQKGWVVFISLSASLREGSTAKNQKGPPLHFH